MGKFLKYELKGTYKFIIGVLVLAALVNMVLLSKIGNWSSELVIGFMVLADFAAFISILVYLINAFKKELYEERGYLTLTLPLSGNKIVGVKLISSFIWFIISGIVASIFFYLFLKSQLGAERMVLGDLVQFTHVKYAVVGIISSVINIMIFMLTIYLSITLSRIALNKKKIGGFISFIIFIALNMAFGYILFKLLQAFPYVLSIDTWEMIPYKELFKQGVDLRLDSGVFMVSTLSGVCINIVGAIFSVITLTGLFLGTGYLVEKKVDI